MTIFNINKSLGWASSGVEYAQMYRNKAFDFANIDYRYVYLEQPLNNILDLAKNIDINSKKIIQMHNIFSDIELSEPKLDFEFISKKYYLNGKNNFFSYEPVYSRNASDKVDFVNIRYKQELQRREHFTSHLSHIDFFNNNKIYKTIWLNKDGSEAISYNHIKKIYYINGYEPLLAEELIELAVKKINVKPKDLVLVDRSLDVIKGVLDGINGRAPISIVIHAEHFNREASDSRYILWNNHYEYVLTHLGSFKNIITATDRQKNKIKSQIPEKFRDKIITIPVGIAPKELKKNNGKNFMTASRLAKEKNLELLIKSFAEANVNNKYHLSIFGEGGQKEKLKNLIIKLNAETTIHLEGHKDLSEIYRNFRYYITTSKSEGFGLTLLEAVSNGLILTGFDVPYGNQTFIRPNKNGFLVNYNGDAESNMTTAIKKLMSLSDVKSNEMSCESLNIASEYNLKIVSEMWENLIEER